MPGLPGSSCGGSGSAVGLLGWCGPCQPSSRQAIWVQTAAPPRQEQVLQPWRQVSPGRHLLGGRTVVAEQSRLVHMAVRSSVQMQSLQSRFQLELGSHTLSTVGTRAVTNKGGRDWYSGLVLLMQSMVRRRASDQRG